MYFQMEEDIHPQEEVFQDVKHVTQCHFDVAENKTVTAEELTVTTSENEVKTEHSEVFDEATYAISSATQAVEEAQDSVTRMKTLLGDFISLDGISEPLRMALNCCKDAATATEGAATVWQELHRQSIQASDLTDGEAQVKVKHELEEENEDGEGEGDRVHGEGGQEEEQDNAEYKEDLVYDEDDCDDDDKYDEDYILTESKIFKKENEEVDQEDEKEMDEVSHKFHCDFCSFSSSKRILLLSHVRREHKDKREVKKYECLECHKSFSNERLYRKHAVDKHMRIPFSCCQCKTLFFNKEEREKHMQDSHPDKIGPDHTCSMCKSFRPPPKTYFKYFRDVGDVHECTLCDFRTSTLSRKVAIRKHIKQHHMDTATFECPQCDYVAKDTSKLKEHTEAVHQGITYPCPWQDCTHQARQKRNLKKHIDHVHKKMDYACKICSFADRNPQMLKKHVDSMHRKDDKYFCDECTFTGGTLHSLNSHKSKAHPPGEKPRNVHDEFMEKDITEVRDEQGECVYKCNLCGHSTYHYANMKYAHMLKHRGEQIQCDHCPFTTKYRTVLVSHINNRHKEHKFRCDQCNYTSGSAFHFKRHYESKHEGAVFKCEFCEYTAVRLEYLQKHKRKHEGKAFKCEIDGCSFIGPFRADLKVHMNAVHKGVRHKCTECDYTSARKGDLNKHVRKVHGTDEDKLKCFRCRFSTSVESALMMHVREAHDPDLVEPMLEEIKFHLQSGGDPSVGSVGPGVLQSPPAAAATISHFSHLAASGAPVTSVDGANGGTLGGFQSPDIEIKMSSPN